LEWFVGVPFTPLVGFLILFNSTQATAAQAGTVQVDLLFTAHQLQQLRLVADLSPTTGATSAQDALSAYLITVLNRVLAVPITRVSSMLGVRLVLFTSLPRA
jgi:hypothetical protein